MSAFSVLEIASLTLLDRYYPESLLSLGLIGRKVDRKVEGHKRHHGATYWIGRHMLTEHQVHGACRVRLFDDSVTHLLSGTVRMLGLHREDDLPAYAVVTWQDNVDRCHHINELVIMPQMYPSPPTDWHSLAWFLEDPLTGRVLEPAAADYRG